MKHTLESIHARCIPAEGDCLIWQGATTPFTGLGARPGHSHAPGARA